jgi:hypothetical protein
LIRFDSRLRLNTPGSISRNPVFDRAQQVVTQGSTVWVILSGPPRSISLACFTDRGGRIGPVTTPNFRPKPANNIGVGSLAAVGNTVYVLGSLGVAGYPVPRACR